MINNLRVFLFFIAIVLFASNYLLCEYFYSEDIDNWWGLKVNINAVVVSLVLLASSIKEKGILRFILDIGVGFTVSNVVIDYTLIQLNSQKQI